MFAEGPLSYIFVLYLKDPILSPEKMNSLLSQRTDMVIIGVPLPGHKPGQAFDVHCILRLTIVNYLYHIIPASSYIIKLLLLKLLECILRNTVENPVLHVHD